MANESPPEILMFEQYVRELESYANAALTGKNEIFQHVDLPKLLNGGVGAELRRRVSLERRQKIGAFFTGENLRRIALNPLLDSATSSAIWDPACGAGDLLLSYADRLPIDSDIGITIKEWEKKIFGNDIEGTFIRAAKSRLILLAFLRGARHTKKHNLTVKSSFPNLVKNNSLSASQRTPSANILLNPPFISTLAEKDCEWGNGSVSAAAVFVEMCTKNSSPGTLITAILPDVLRTGARYERWRNLISEYAEIRRVEIYGPFDPQADVDVFILELKTRVSRSQESCQYVNWGHEVNNSDDKVGNHFAVSVGSVVPHRHAESGSTVAFLHSREAPPWGTLNEISSRRQFSGTTHTPPFVVIRRTSSPSDQNRAIGTIVNCPEPVAIENHLIVCKPNDGKFETCANLLATLTSKRTNDWLNSRIRCRHLTVGAVKDIPLETNNNRPSIDFDNNS